MVLVDSRRIPRAPRYSGTNQTHMSVLTIYATITPYGRPSQAIQLNTNTQAHSRQKALTGLPHNTTHTNPRRGHTRTRFSHHPLSLATTHRISSPMGTKMFQFPTFPPNNYYNFIRLVVRHEPYWVTPFGNPRINTCSSTPRGISQTATSFISSQHQGIHRTPQQN